MPTHEQIKAAARRALTQLLPAEYLSNFRWYRRQQGGFWEHSDRLGWRKIEQDHVINLVLYHSKRLPKLYGKDIEDYRAAAVAIGEHIGGSDEG